MVDTDVSVTDARPITVGLADDDELLREALAYLIEAQPDLHVIGHAANGREAVDVAAALQPDVMLMDIRMPELDGIEATRLIRASGSTTRVLMLTTFDEDEYVIEAFRQGADGFLLKRSGADVLHRAIVTVSHGDALVDPDLTRTLINGCIAPRPRSVDLAAKYHLTSREIDVLAELAAGHSNDAIASRLGVAAFTVKSHLSSIFAKIGCSTRVQAVVFAFDTGLVTPQRRRSIRTESRPH